MQDHQGPFNGVDQIIKALRILATDGRPELRAERRKLLDEFLEINDKMEFEFEKSDPKGKSRQQLLESRKRLLVLKPQYEAIISKIREHLKRVDQEIPPPPVASTTHRTEPATKPNHATSNSSKEVLMLKEFETADGRKISYTPKKLGLRGMRNLLECVEGIKETTKKSEIFELVENGLKLCIADYDPETMDVTLDSAMKIMSESLTFNTSKQETKEETKQETE